MTRYGWDISNHDWDRHAVSLADAKKAGVSLVTHKITEGTSYVDPDFARFARQLKQTPFPVEGSYHVLHKGNIAAQVDYWLAALEEKFPGWRGRECWIWQIDAERWPDGNPTPAEVEQAGARVVTKTKCDPAQVVVYGPGWVYGDTLKRLPYHLWQSNYGANPVGGFRKVYPGDDSVGWAAYSGQVPTILQYGSRTRIGQQPTCDANAIRVATDDALQALFLPTREVDMPTAAEFAKEVWDYPIEVVEGQDPWRASTLFRNIRVEALKAYHAALATTDASKIAKDIVADLPKNTGSLTAADIEASAEKAVRKVLADAAAADQ